MLLNGIWVTRKTLFGIVLISIIVVIALLSLLIKLNQENNLDSKPYSEKLLSLSEKSEEITMGDIFDFDFDKAYVSDAVYGDEEYFIKKLDVNTNIEIRTLESGVHNRILFIKDNSIIYDFVYEMYQIPISEKGIWIFQNTKLKMQSDGSIVFG